MNNKNDIEELRNKAIEGNDIIEEFNTEEENQLPKSISNKLIKDVLLFCGTGSLFFYIGIKKGELSFFVMGTLLFAISIIMMIGTKRAFDKGNIAEKHGVIMNIERMAIMKNNAKLFIQTVEREHFMIRVNDKLNPYKVGDELLFYYRKDKNILKDGGTYLLSEPLSIKIMSRAYEDEEDIKENKHILEKVKSYLYK